MAEQDNFPSLGEQGGFPSLGGEQKQGKNDVVLDSWEQDIPKQEIKKPKKKLKLRQNNQAQPFDYNPYQQQQFDQFGVQQFGGFDPSQQYQQGGFDQQNFYQNQQYGGYQQDQQFGQQQYGDYQQDPFGQQQDQYGQQYNQYNQGYDQQQQQQQQQDDQPQETNFFDKYFEPQQEQDCEQEIVYLPLEKFELKKYGGLFTERHVKDQFDNYYELEEGQYLENGQIYFQEDNQEQDDYWDNYKPTTKTTTQQNKKKPVQQKKQEKKPVEKKKPVARPVKLPKQPESDQTKLNKMLLKQRKQQAFTMKELEQKEKDAHAKNSAYEKVDIERESMNIVFIGHVDAGKSTLSGRILIDSGEIDEKTVKQFEEEAKANGREGWYMAYAMDLSEDERSKGKTVETGKAFFQLSKRRFTLLDAPGHKNYVPNMIAGACQSDMACLIISSKPGEFEAGFEKGGQTTEHVQLIRALGVQNLVCVVSKMDTNNWSIDRFNQIKNEFGPWLKKICNFDTIDFIPVNAFDSSNISRRVDPGICSWYDGPSLFEYLNTVKVPKRQPESSVKVPILDVQKEEGKTVIYGKVEAGAICEGMWLTVMPNQLDVQVTEIYDARDKRLYYAPAGENVKFKIKDKDIKEGELQRGFVICSTNDLCGVAQEYIAEVQLLELPEQKSVMSSGYTCVLHMHTTVVEVDVSEVQAIYDRTMGKFIKNPLLKSGDKGIVKVKSTKEICLEKFENVPYLGRFTLRDENITIAYGTVKKFKPCLEFQQLQAKIQKQSQKK